MTPLLSDSNARLAAARRLTRRPARRETGLFLAEGAQAVREALAAGVVESVFVTADARQRHGELLADAGVRVDEISARAAAALSETVTPQGLVAVCRCVDVPLSLAGARLAVGLVAPGDPGNAGTILRTADAAGASHVVFAGTGVDPYNGKCVRASAGSLFHVSVSVVAEPSALVETARTAGLRALATTGSATADLFGLSDALAAPTLWLFGNEAHGLPADVLAACDEQVRIPIFGRAESLNLAAAAAVCLYASAAAQRPWPR